VGGAGGGEAVEEEGAEGGDAEELAELGDRGEEARIEQLRGMADPMIGCPVHGRPLSEIIATKTERAEKQASRAL
jgi:hypothetical protein